MPAPRAPDRVRWSHDPTCPLTLVGTGRRSPFLPRHPTRPDRISPVVEELTLSTGYHAVGMIKGGMTQAQVARDLGVGVDTIRRWQIRDRQ